MDFPNPTISTLDMYAPVLCTRLAFFDTDSIRVPSRALHAEASDICPLLAVGVHLINSELF